MASAASSLTPQQQLAEVQEAARRSHRPALAQAAFMGRLPVVALLLQRDSSSGDDRAAAVRAAAHGGHPACLRVLLGAPPPPSVGELVLAAEAGGHCPLMLAAAGGHAGCVELLLRAHDPGAQVAAVASTGWNALICAAISGHAECVRLLLRHSPEAQAAAATSLGNHALPLTAGKGHLRCLRLLLQAHSPPLRRLDEALAKALDGWAGEQAQQAQHGGGAAASGQPFQRCVELLLSKGAMLAPRAPAEALALVRPVVRDLAARALAPDAANEVAAQALEAARRREAEKGARPGASAGAGVSGAAWAPQAKGRKRAGGAGGSNADGSCRKRR